MRAFFAGKRNLSIALVFVVVVSVLAWPAYRHFYGRSDLVSSRSSVMIEPTVSDEQGVDTRSDFVLSSKESLDEDSVKNNLSVTPKTDFTVQKKSSKEFVVRFSKPLRENTVYAFRLALSVPDATTAQGAEDTAVDTSRALSWAFQTKNPFRVVSTLPANTATDIPVNSGIEITLSHEGAPDMASAFDISPKVAGKFEMHKKTAVFVPEKLDFATVYTVTVKKGFGLGGEKGVLNEDKIFRFETVSEKNGKSKRQLGFVKDMYEVSSIDKPALDVYLSAINGDAKVQVSSFRFSGQED